MRRSPRRSVAVAVLGTAAATLLLPAVNAAATTTASTATVAKASATTLAPAVKFVMAGTVRKVGAKGLNNQTVSLYKRRNSSDSWHLVASKKTATIKLVPGSYAFPLTAATTSYQYFVKHPRQTISGVIYTASSSAITTTKVVPRTLTVAPNAYVYPGSIATVAGKAFQPGATVTVWQCSALNLAACDTNPAHSASTKVLANGSFAGLAFPFQLGPVGSGTCLAGANCYLFATTTPAAPVFAAASARLIHLTNVSASPTAGLVDGQTVQVSASNLPPSTGLYLAQCDMTPGGKGCDVLNLGFAATDAAGSLVSAPFVVHTTVCTDQTLSCMLMVANNQDFSAYGGLPLTFAAPAPAP